jgi:hypothetical protein
LSLALPYGDTGAVRKVDNVIETRGNIMSYSTPELFLIGRAKNLVLDTSPMKDDIMCAENLEVSGPQLCYNNFGAW